MPAHDTLASPWVISILNIAIYFPTTPRLYSFIFPQNSLVKYQVVQLSSTFHKTILNGTALYTYKPRRSQRYQLSCRTRHCLLHCSDNTCLLFVANVLPYFTLLVTTFDIKLDSLTWHASMRSRCDPRVLLDNYCTSEEGMGMVYRLNDWKEKENLD